MSVYLPPDSIEFPHPFEADDEGFLAFGGNLTQASILNAYTNGIFPWYNEGEPILWWFTNPRCVLFPEKLKVHKSMRSYLNQDKFDWSIDTAFDHVLNNCRTKTRKGQNGTWITNEMFEAYSELHEKGYAHSVEVWEDQKLVGGLYGLSLGRIFFGESMFSFRSNASKFALIKFIEVLRRKGFWLIDCQQTTDHIVSMGAEEISKDHFYDFLQKNKKEDDLVGKWTAFKE